MKKWMGTALAMCLLLTACGAETTQAPEQEKPPAAPEKESVQPQEQPEVPEETEPADWQLAYAAFLEGLAERVKTLRDTDRPDYDPNTVELEIGEASGTYVLYDIDKDGIPELLIRYGLGEAGYPIADNDAPALSADRLEYTLGNLLNYGFADLKSIEAMYRDLTVGQDERGRPELVFRTPEQAAAFARGALRNSRVYVADEDRFSMQFLADLLGLALERGAVTRRDLWTTESAVIGKLERDMVCGPLWRRFCGYSRIFRSQERPEAGEWVRVNAKKRYIDPLVSGMGRVSHLDGTFRRELKEFKMLDFSCWLCAETEKSGIV